MPEDHVRRSEHVAVQKDLEYIQKASEETREILNKKADKEELEDIKKGLEKKSDKDDVTLLQRIVFGAVALILAGVLTGLLQLIV